MPDLPALPLQPPVPNPRQTGTARRPRIEGPGPAAQERRLGPALQRLTNAFNAQRVQLVGDPQGLEPDQILVLEIAGEIDDFVRAVQRVPGLEYLAEEVEDKLDPDEFAAVDLQGRRHSYARQLFLVASDARAWQELLRLWRLFQQGGDFPRGLTPFRHLFARLRELRPWDDRDRLERTGALDAWERELGDLRGELVEFEIELWLRASQQRRSAAVANLRADLRAAGGDLLTEAVHEEIDYHGVLGRVPAHRLRDAVANHEIRWLRTGAVRFFHAVGQMAAPLSADDAAPDAAQLPPAPLPEGPPRIALLDGLPLAGHDLLRGRIFVDDPDGWDATIPVARRVHGTGMASIVVHGDLNGAGQPLATPVYVRAVLSPDAPEWVRDAPEELPRDRLAVDMINAAVTRVFEGDAVATGVRAIVLAIGDRVLQFDRFVSPLARLLDWLAFRHDVVFLVSAGNHLEPLEIPAEVDTSNPEELQHELLCAVGRAASLRRLLAPAETINGLTVGAAHADESAHTVSDGRVEPFVTADLPNLGSAFGSGVRRAVKPDILLPGGRQLLRLEPPQDGRRLATVPPTRRPPGVRLAAPGTEGGALDATVYDTGTSIAAALAGHYAGRLVETLAMLRALHGDLMPGPDLDGVLLKAALVHSARWGTARTFLDPVNNELGLSRSRDSVGRRVGFGRATPERALVCDDHIVTVVAAGRIGKDDAHTYSFPLPASLASRTDRRRVSLTLAWLTPINPRHRYYRRAALKLEPAGPTDLLGDRTDIDLYGARRGTVQHEVLVGDRAVPYAPGTALELVVSCRADAGALESQVPYAVMATVEVAAQAGLPIYEEVRQALRVPVAVRAARQ
jgi:hypothetical protein